VGSVKRGVAFVVVGFLMILTCMIGIAITSTSGVDDAPSRETTSASGDPTKLDDSAKLACEDFASDWAAAQTDTARIKLADKVNKWSSRSTTPGIAEGGRLLGRMAGKSEGSWQLAGDVFAKACLDGGYGK